MNSLNKNKSNLIYVGLYTLTLFIILLRKYSISILKKEMVPASITSVLFYSSIALLFLQFIIRKKHNITELLIFVSACVLYILTREGSILVLILLAISVRDIDDKYVVKSYMVLNLLFIFACMLIGNLMPYIAQVPEVHYRVIEGAYVARETFGFTNPNSIFLFVLPVYAGYIYLRFDKYDVFDRIILIVTTFYIYNKTMSRTGFATLLGSLLFLEILIKIDFKKSKIIANIIKLVPVILLISSMLIGTLLSEVPFINKLLASRPQHWNVYLSQEGNVLSLFGRVFSESTRAAHPLDSSYIYILAFLGVVSLVFFMYLIYKGLEIFIEKNDKKNIAIVMIFLIYALAENILLEAGYNFTIVLLIKHVINKNKNNFTIKEAFAMLKNKFRR